LWRWSRRIFLRGRKGEGRWISSRVSQRRSFGQLGSSYLVLLFWGLVVFKSCWRCLGYELEICSFGVMESRRFISIGRYLLPRFRKIFWISILSSVGRSLPSFLMRSTLMISVFMADNHQD
jgi:hypothetical protein